MSNDYAPVPDADLETAFLELLAEVRKQSASGASAEHAAKAALDGLKELAGTIRTQNDRSNAAADTRLAQAECVLAQAQEVMKQINKPKEISIFGSVLIGNILEITEKVCLLVGSIAGIVFIIIFALKIITG